MFRAALLSGLIAAAACAAGLDDSDPGAAGGAGERPSGSPSGGAGAGAGGNGAVAGAGGGAGGMPAAAPGAPVLFSEIMYHPVDERDAVDNHEFLELANRTAAAVSIAGWRLEGVVAYTFPAGTTIGPRKHLVVAKNRDALLSVKKYALAPADVAGPYMGELDNGGGTLRLLDDKGQLMDVVAYNDRFPWPLAADAFGASEAWLGKPYVPFADHRDLGCSLQRFSFDVPATEIANWDASAIDGATPGQPNPRAGDPPAIVEALVATAEGAEGLIRADSKIVVRARVSARGTMNQLVLKSFVDVLDKSDEPVSLDKMTRGAETWDVTLPARPANTIVRYQVWGDRGQGLVQLSPRPSDPHQWHGLFVSPALATKARVYHLFIDTAKWQQMYTNIAPAAGTRPVRVLADKCTPNPSWNARVPATFVYEGKVYDAQVRYSGSDLNRLNGAAITNFPYPHPQLPNPLLVLGLKVKFPKYAAFEGKKGIKLNKLNQSCPGINEIIGGKIFNAAGLADSDPRYARVYINGGYYHYMLETAERHEEFIKQSQPKGMPVGDLFKVQGLFDGDDGPYGRADFSPMRDNAACNIKAADRYAWSYARKTNDWKAGSEVEPATAIEGLAAAKASGTLKAYLERTFDVNQVLTYIALRNWSGNWDDGHHNHLLYKKPDGRWIVLPLDHDREYGGAMPQMLPPTASFYIGELGDPNNGPGTPGKLNWIKDAFFKTFRAEYNKRLLDLDKTLLDPATIAKLIDEGAAAFSVEDWKASPAGRPTQSNCTDPKVIYDLIRQWTQARREQLRAVIK